MTAQKGEREEALIENLRNPAFPPGNEALFLMLEAADTIERLLSSSAAEGAMREALEEIAMHPGPNADEAAWWRHDRAKEALATLSKESS